MDTANLTYMKGVRTRFYNTLDKEVNAGLHSLDEFMIIDQESAQEVKVLRRKVSECKLKIETYINKLGNQSEKLAEAIANSDEEFTQTVIEADCDLCEKAWTVCYKLKLLEDELKGKERAFAIEDETTSSATDDMLKMYDMQMKLQQTFLEKQQENSERQLEIQKELLVKQTLHEKSLKATVKLPQLDICSFSGNRLQWTEFWDSFESAVHKNDKLSSVDKFNYLKSKLSGEARSAISGLSLSNDNYRVAVQTLKDRYGDTQNIIDLHYKQLMSLEPVKNTTESLRFFLDKVERHLRSLEVLNQDTDQQVFVSMIRSKLPSEVLLQLEIIKGVESVWTVNKLRDLLRQFIVSKEKAEKGRQIERVAPHNSSDGQKNKAKDESFRFKNGLYGARLKYSTGALVANERNQGSPPKKCRYCGNAHWSDECNKFKTADERKRQLKGSCYKCLRDNHQAKDCKSSKLCVHCGKFNTHHRSLCDKKFSKSDRKERAHLAEEEECTNEQKEEVGLLSCGETVIMQTALTEVKGTEKGNGKEIRLLLDSGSHRTYISKALAKKLDLKEEKEQEISVLTFGSKTSQKIKTKTTTIQIKLKNGIYMPMTANIVPNISGTIHRHPVQITNSQRYRELTKTLKLADTVPEQAEANELELLVGNDYYLDIVELDRIEVSSGLYLLSSKLGWILSGRTQQSSANKVQEDMNMLILTHGIDIVENSLFSQIDDALPIKPTLEDFWKLEAIGINETAENVDDQRVMQHFKDTLKRENGRYQVTWPWKEEFPELPENRNLSIGRLRSLTNKIQKQPELTKRYDDIIQDQLEKGVIEKVDRHICDGMKHYIPHHVVIKPLKTTTKLRVVYDASAKVRKEAKCLNECLYRGPVLLRDLCGMIMRFRLPKIGIVSDIEKAFLQVELQPSERDVTRFLWFKNIDDLKIDEEHMQEFRFCRVPFGIISSPFLLGATIECHLDKYDSELANQLKENIYMDNLVTGKDTEEESVALYQEAKSMFSDAKMNLREWKTNNEHVNKSIPEEDQANDDIIKVLGHTWNTNTDTICIQRSEILHKELKMTKRNVLRQLASVYDPLGLFAPVILNGKEFMQQLWIKQLDWDDPLDKNDEVKWGQIREELIQIDGIEIRRCIGADKSDGDSRTMLVCFCDASSKAYGTAIYLVQETTKGTRSDLIFSKTRLSPIKSTTIARLELLAVLIGVRCLKFVQDQLQMPLEDVLLMTDSQCVLDWVRSSKVLPVFVENRVKEIRKQDHITFSHVRTSQNAADVVSRGTTLTDLKQKEMWWHGPMWLKLPQNEWPCLKRDSDKMKNVKEPANKEDAMLTQAVNDQSPFGLKEENVSSVIKLWRITAWCLRFIRRTRNKSDCSDHLTSSEIQEAEIIWIKHSQKRHCADVMKSLLEKKPNNLARQLDVFIDGDGILRCGGRLKNADFSEAARFPILLPPQDRITMLIIERVHKRILHSGVSQTLSELRQKYWIPRGRAAVRKVVRKCLVCTKMEGGAYKLPPMAPLPKSRVSESSPFSRVGLDYLGPIHIKENQETQKVWVCLFTCLVTRAVHLEVVQDMSAITFLMCLRRFVAAKGTPREIISDNAKQFKLSNDTLKLIWKTVVNSEEIQNYASNESIKWTFIVELAPWMGGFYERLVGLVKRALRKTIGRKLLSLEQITTLIKECEAVINSRPLVYIGDDLKSSIPLTPRHFICLNPNTGIPDLECDHDDPDYIPYDSSANKLLKLWTKGQRMLDTFWQVWRNEYLISLRERTQNRIKSPRVQSHAKPSVGDVVLIKDNLPRGQWKMGKITHLQKSSDGQIRSAGLRTYSGTLLRRPFNLLFPVEVSSSEDK